MKDTTDTTRNINERIEAARANFKPIVKDKSNSFFKTSYATLDNIVNCVQPALLAEGVRIENRCEVLGDVFVLHTSLVVIETGVREVSTIPIAIGKPQDQGGAITYARRYNLTALLNLLTEDDDDGNQSSGNYAPAPTKQQSRKTSDVVVPLAAESSNVW